MTPAVRFGTLDAYLDLMDRTTYRVRYPGIGAPPAGDGMLERVVTVPLMVSATTADGLYQARTALEDMLASAASTLQTRASAADRITLSVQAGTAGWTFIDVRRGTVDGWELLPDGIHAYCTLTLTCRPLMRGDAIQAQNLLADPCNPTATGWTKTNVTATASVAAAPDGSTTAGRVRETATTAEHGMAQSITKAATATVYTASAYVKADGRDRLRLRLMSGANGAGATFRLDTGVVSTAAALIGSGWADASAVIVADGGWWRVSVTATSDTTTTATLDLRIDNGSGVSYAGDTGKGLLVWGAQVEEGATPGLLLVPTMLPASVKNAWTETGYEYDEPSGSFNYTADPDNLVSRSDFTSSNMTRQASYSDPSGGTSAERFVDNSVASSVRYVSSQGDPTPSSLPRNYTGAIYVKNYAGRNTPTIVFRESGGDSVYFEVNMTDGTMGSVTTAGSKVTLVSREVQAVASSWYWVRITATIGSGAGDLEFRIYPNGTAAYAGTTTYGVIVWRPQIVTGDTIDDPQILTTVVVDPIEHAAVTVGAGRQSGAWVYGIPGDAPALYRAELDDNSATVAVNRVHIGAWSGPGVLLDEVEPFSIAAASDAAAMVSDGSGNIGTSYPTMGADLDWSAVGSVSLTDLTSRRGSADVIARVKDGSSYLSQPQSLEASVTGGIYARRISRIYRDASTGMGFGAPRVTPGSTLVMLVQWTALIGAGTPTMSGTGGLTWTKIGQVEEGFSRFAWWYAKDVTQPTSQIAVTWAGTAGFPAATLVEIIGAAADPFDKWAGASVSSRYHNTSYSATLGSATAQAHSLLLSAGLGLGIANNPLTVPSGYWRVVSSLSSGGVGALTVTSTGAYGVTWDRPPGIVDSGEGWIVAIAAFKAAAATGSSITVGQWQNCVTAVDAAGNESLPTGVVSVPVPSTSSAVALTWTPPATGTPTKYRVYRQHVDTWAYVEVTAPATSYIWTSESVYTNAMPPTVAPPVAAWRAAVSLPSGETLWRSQASASSNLASGLWEDISLGSLPLPPIASGEGVTPDEARLTVEAAHLTGAIVGVNGIWLVDSAEGQTVSHRIGMAADAPADWVVDTNRDGVTSAWLRDPTTGDEAGQLAIRGQQTLSPGNAQIVVRPEVAAGESDMVAGNLSIRRLLITPRWRYLRGID
ncbi:MAG TPA: hypothetical protein DEG70_01695 [Chloroflexi bacterium]|nr:hypothetical protein [Chloroflexota bacterium]